MFAGTLSYYKEQIILARLDVLNFFIILFSNIPKIVRTLLRVICANICETACSIQFQTHKVGLLLKINQ